MRRKKRDYITDPLTGKRKVDKRTPYAKTKDALKEALAESAHNAARAEEAIAVAKQATQIAAEAVAESIKDRAENIDLKRTILAMGRNSNRLERMLAERAVEIGRLETVLTDTRGELGEELAKQVEADLAKA